MIAALALLAWAQGAEPAPQRSSIYRDCQAEARAARARGQGDVVVCGEREVRSPYRIPEQDGFDPAGTVQSVSRERHSLYEVGDSGIGSCGTVGPGGWTGCMHRSWKQAREQYGK